MASAARRQIIGGGAPINKSRRRRPQIVGGGGAHKLSAAAAPTKCRRWRPAHGSIPKTSNLDSSIIKIMFAAGRLWVRKSLAALAYTLDLPRASSTMTQSLISELPHLCNLTRISHMQILSRK